LSADLCIIGESLGTSSHAVRGSVPSVDMRLW